MLLHSLLRSRNAENRSHRGEKLMQLHVRVMGFDTEEFALQLAMIYTRSVDCIMLDPITWMIGENGSLLKLTDMAPIETDELALDDEEFFALLLDEGVEEETWRYFLIEFDQDEYGWMGLESLRQTLLVYVPDAQFFDPEAGIEIGFVMPVVDVDSDEDPRVPSLMEMFFDRYYDEPDPMTATA